MISDTFLVRESTLEKTLNKVEHLAACYEFGGKELLQIRLLAEEVLSLVRPTLALADGDCSVAVGKEGFAVTIGCAAGSEAMDEKTRGVLLDIGRNAKKEGAFGMIGKLFEYLASPEFSMGAAMSMDHSLMCRNTGGFGGMYDYGWSADFSELLSTRDAAARPAKKDPKDVHALEISIVESYADDIQVFLRRGVRKEPRLEITVVKRLNEAQTADVIFREG